MRPSHEQATSVVVVVVVVIVAVVVVVALDLRLRCIYIYCLGHVGFVHRIDYPTEQSLV